MNITHILADHLAVLVTRMTVAQLEHALQLCNVAVDTYKRVCKNYSPDKMIRYGTPHLERLRDRVRIVEDELLRRK